MNWKAALEAISNALSVIAAAANTPGINLIPYMSVVAAAAGALQAGLNAGVKVAPYILAIKETFANGLPSEAARAALAVKIKELEALVDAPLPPKEEGEED